MNCTSPSYSRPHSIKEELSALEFVRLRLHLEAQESLYLPPYKGSTFRGTFGIVFKRTVCIVRHGECQRCLLQKQCVYPYAFDTPVLGGPGIFRGFQDAPHPYLIEPPLEQKKEYAPGDRLIVGLTLVGKIIDYLPYFIHVFSQMGEQGLGKSRGKCVLIAGEALHSNGCWEQVYDGKTLCNDVRPTKGSDLPDMPTGPHLTLRFLTPTQLKTDGAFNRALSFPILIRGLIRRLSALSAFHCGKEPALDFQQLVAQAETVETVAQDLRWYPWERYSQRKQQRMKMDGFIGEVKFLGDWSAFQLFLALGVHLHVGKGTSFGMGQYEME